MIWAFDIDLELLKLQKRILMMLGNSTGVPSMHTKKKMQWAYALLSCQKMPCKIFLNFFPPFFFSRDAVAAEQVQRGEAHGSSGRGEKKKWPKNCKKKLGELLYAKHLFCLVVARPPLAAATAATAATATATTTFKGGQIWLGHPLHY